LQELENVFLPCLLLGMLTSSRRRLEMCVAVGRELAKLIELVKKEFKVSVTKFMNFATYQ